MKIHEFDIKKGIYKFELNDIETEFHSHPTFEILFSKDGRIEIETNKCKYSNLSFAIIEPNTLHKIKNDKNDIVVLMVECNSNYLREILSNFDIQLFEGIFIESQKINREPVISEIICKLRKSAISIVTDIRVIKSLNYLNNSSSEYTILMTELKSQVNLSDSRLSHLFKEEIGISIKKYFVWSKLKRAFKKVLNENKTMYQASIEVGFYDQAHLSKAYKQVLGITPSYVYNSRTLQV